MKQKDSFMRVKTFIALSSEMCISKYSLKNNSLTHYNKSDILAGSWVMRKKKYMKKLQKTGYSGNVVVWNRSIFVLKFDTTI